MKKSIDDLGVAFNNNLYGQCKIHQIGNSLGIIIPKNFGVLHKGQHIPYMFKNGYLVLNLKKPLLKRRGQIINNSFADKNKSMSESDVGKQLKKDWGTDFGWNNQK